MQTDDYIVRLDRFEGPLDLLLHLIRRAEVEIVDIPIAVIADQYIEHLRGISDIDIELAGEFLVMAATLMEIKSRMISPPSGDARGVRDTADTLADALTDPRSELVQQLLAYKRYRDAADALEVRRATWERRFPASPAGLSSPAPGEDADASLPDLDLEDLELYDLVEAFAHIIETVDLEQATRGAHQVAYDDTPIELHAEDILDRLRRMEADSDRAAVPARLTLRQLLTGRARSEMIGLFLAMLELIRHRSIVVKFTGDAEDVDITLNHDPQEDAPELGTELEAIEHDPGGLAEPKLAMDAASAAADWDDEDIFDDDDDDEDEDLE